MILVKTVELLVAVLLLVYCVKLAKTVELLME